VKPRVKALTASTSEAFSSSTPSTIQVSHTQCGTNGLKPRSTYQLSIKHLHLSSSEVDNKLWFLPHSPVMFSKLSCEAGRPKASQSGNIEAEIQNDTRVDEIWSVETMDSTQGPSLAGARDHGVTSHLFLLGQETSARRCSWPASLQA